ncbi:helix-turn-helix transcriptional regulator [Robertmurraya massiliosenegalensis]|uniref:helix-turn-helix transcriptional regulator n=1 Tax=Robertmurraya TaxID=2837507 RepID=UPI0039A5229E
MEFSCRLRIIFAEIKSKDKNFNQETFAKKIGITKGTLSSLVNEHTLPSFKVAYTIATELKIPIEEIWVLKDKK